MSGYEISAWRIGGMNGRQAGGKGSSTKADQMAGWLTDGSYRKCRGPQYIHPVVVSSPDLKAFLSASPFFGGLSGASLDLLIIMLVERRFEIGATAAGR